MREELAVRELYVTTQTGPDDGTDGGDGAGSTIRAQVRLEMTVRQIWRIFWGARAIVRVRLTTETRLRGSIRSAAAVEVEPVRWLF